MAFEPFNSVGGYTVGIPPIPIINENGVATLNGLQVSGLSNLGSVGNVRILGGTSGYYLQTNGSGNLTWAPGGGSGNGTPGGSNTQVQFNDAGNFGGAAGFTYDSINNILTVSGNIISNNFAGTGNITIASINANGNITANYLIGNGSQLTGISATTANFANYAGNVTVSSQPNITSVGTLVSLDVTGNVTAGKVKTDYLLYANGDPYQFTTNAAGTNTQVQFNNNNAFSASANFTFDNTTNTLSVTNITSNGAGLSSLTGANVTGQVSYSNISNSVAVANVVGIGNISVINLDGNGSNILHGNGYWGPEAGNGSANYANFAGEAFSVSASNIVGNVNLANFATTANAVAGANVSGAVNLANYASVANSVAGANVTGTVANATYAINAGVANTAGTVTTNSQPNITSVGTLIGLTVAGNILPSANVTYNLGSPTLRWKDLYVSGNTIDLNGSTISSNANGITLTNPLGGTFTVVGTGSANTASINSGNSSIIIQPNSEIDFNVTGTSNIVVISNNGLLVNANANVTGNSITNNLTVNLALSGNTANFTGNVIANSFQMGSGVYKFYTQSVYFSTTTSTSPNQVIWSVPVANVSAVDFTIIATDIVGNSRQQCKITATILGSAVVYNEYAGLYINGGVGSFSVAYAGGGTPSVQLLVTPDSVNLTEYSILIAEYTP